MVVLCPDMTEDDLLNLTQRYEEIFPYIGRVGMGPTPEAKAEAAEQLTVGLQLLDEAFRECSKGKSFFGGDTIGYLDLALGAHLGWLKTIEQMSGTVFLDEVKLPLLVGWAERFCNDAAVKKVMPETEKLLGYAKMLMAKVNAPPAQ